VVKRLRHPVRIALTLILKGYFNFMLPITDHVATITNTRVFNRRNQPMASRRKNGSPLIDEKQPRGFYGFISGSFRYCGQRLSIWAARASAFVFSLDRLRRGPQLTSSKR
jgi:hypothetical protein